ncbi:FHA domain-containing protein [Methylobacterium sp. D48H]
MMLQLYQHPMNIMNRVMARAALVSLIAICCSAPVNADEGKVTINQDRIIAEMQVLSDVALVRWRFLGQPNYPIDNISATVSDQPLGEPEWSPYPGPNDATRILVLLDSTGQTRSEALKKQIAALFVLADRTSLNDSMGVVVYGSETKLLPVAKPEELVISLAALEPENVDPDLNQVLRDSINAIAAVRGQRKGIFVFSDGFSKFPLQEEVLIHNALDNGVSIYFVVGGNDRPVEYSKLQDIASHTGGRVVSDNNLKEFLQKPFEVLKSGGLAAFPLPPQRRWFWQASPEVQVTFHMGPERAVINSYMKNYERIPFDYFKSHALETLLPGALAAFFITAGTLMVRSRKKTVAQQKRDEENQEANVIIEEIDTGRAHPVNDFPASIGRSEQNTVVIVNSTVSSHHALIVKNDDGTYAITCKSNTNKTKINNIKSEQACLSDGDLIQLGDVNLRFFVVK